MLIHKIGFLGLSRHHLILFITICILSHSTLVCASQSTREIEYIKTEPCLYYDDLTFNSTAANQSIKWQVDLGPRLPGSNASNILRESIKENLSEWNFTEETHERANFNLTNLIATYKPENSSNQEIFLVAHYDTRDRAERDGNESLSEIPIDGANDGASGVSVLIELGKIIPQMNLNYTVKMLFTDGEDQGENPGIFGSRAWAENRSDEELSNISAFIVIDMIGDLDLHFTHVWPGSSELWMTIEPLAQGLGFVIGENDCLGNISSDDVFDIETSIGVIDDHVAAHDRGVPAIDIIDIRYGEGAEEWGGHWHTHNDTIDKVSSESLGKIGRLIELGLRSSSWLLENNDLQDVNSTGQNEEVENPNKTIIESSKLLGMVALSIVFSLFLVIFILDYRIKKI